MGQDKTENSFYIVATALKDLGLPAVNYIAPLEQNEITMPRYANTGRLVHGGFLIVKGQKYILPRAKLDAHKGWFDLETVEAYEQETLVPQRAAQAAKPKKR